MDQFKAFEQIQSPIWIYDFDHKAILWANHAALTLWESPHLAELTDRDLTIGMSQAIESTLESYRRTFEQGECIRKWWNLTPKNIHKRVLCDLSGITLDDGRIAMFCHALSEENCLRTSLAFSDSANLSLLFDLSGNLLSANEAFQHRYHLLLQHLSTLTGSDQRANKWLTEVQAKGEIEKESTLAIGSQSCTFRVFATWLKKNQQILVELIDITKQKNQILTAQFEASHDCLTGLYNRRGLLEQATSWSQTDHSFHLIFIDLDGFKMINDTYGHGQGDSLLISVGRRLQQSLTDALALARFGGDEFVALLPTHSDITSRLSDINRFLRRPYTLDNSMTVAVNASIGCSTFESGAILHVETLIQYADFAMHKAKEQGKNRYQVFTPDLAQAMLRKFLIRQHLARALENNQFTLYFQPILCSQTNNVCGAEALLRWHDQALGNIPPAEFIPIAEESGQIVALGDWVLNQAIKQLSVWQTKFEQPFVISINVSRVQLHRAFCEQLNQRLNSYRVSPHQVAIELTESCMVYKMEDVKQWLTDVSQLGVKIYLDDFGTGYSSLSVLQQLPIDLVKLDKSFVQSSHESGLAIIQATSAICEKLGLTMLAEGIEQPEQHEVVCQNNYAYLQGYLLGRPIPAHEFEQRYLTAKTINTAASA
ncbi:EAL domain-containing protein [Vibrio scophthalmi]|uniref:Uncharacterized protein n=1 Tax=Vibrio scophthalmi LMG 19158 TaxID=870967 RepID=F9RQB8_9VIBR|nr:EAL domain-containing protein [Vibrio scophthalmi]EGU34584.1 hypothetical protein VIS19158_13337 [Vibrio scophthalmi LMG 19158]